MTRYGWPHNHSCYYRPSCFLCRIQWEAHMLALVLHSRKPARTGIREETK